ncbi:Endonuclease/Exonuclease/phosphatase family protein [Chitinophaga rupis]|uniref:Endonuclease/Exonuclease/phosphatase family protein n=1 Tax=Chitinophaga rupis TaxID=573321 RepID=A0A1H7KLW4_9BACT|nr:endonuclease/exonuclease/phosphatase family protein [Chitinophaga rupis]SEK87506.1 Endonuclease/Exonuclease/phosphatase family protein [Chitinophaga rupis]
MNICFWNLNNQDLTDLLYDLVEEQNIDLLFLAECDLKPGDVLRKLNRSNNAFYFCAGINCDKIQIYTRFKDSLLGLLSETRRITARDLYSPVLNNSITLLCLHLPSKVNWTGDDQAAYLLGVKSFIDSVESLVGHKRTVVFGDFNMHPFEHGLVQNTGFHTTMEKAIAKRLSRKVDGIDYDFFYNPMWSFLGDLGRGEVSGTHYYSPAKPISYHWNLFDQVIMRPELIDYFDDDYLDIITAIKGTRLLTKAGIIDAKHFSDHLPIKFSYKL